MSESTTPPNGTPIWWDLASKDVDASKQFYSALFGWEWEDVMSGPEGVFSRASINGKSIGAIYTQGADVPQPPGPTMWVHTFWVDDAEAAVRHAEERGAQVLVPVNRDPAVDGLKALLLNHEGVPFVVWSSDSAVENEAFGEMGAVCWTEYYTRDVAGTNDFLRHVFETRYDRLELPMPPEWNTGDDAGGDASASYEYYVLKVKGLPAVRGGMLFMDESWGEMPSHFMTYFRVEDVDASAKQATELGGEICVPPTTIPTGRFAVLNDSLGSTFSIITYTDADVIDVLQLPD